MGYRAATMSAAQQARIISRNRYSSQSLELCPLLRLASVVLVTKNCNELLRAHGLCSRLGSEAGGRERAPRRRQRQDQDIRKVLVINFGPYQVQIRLERVHCTCVTISPPSLALDW